MPIFNFQKDNGNLTKSEQKGDHKRKRNICVTVRMSEEEKIQMERKFAESFLESKQAFLLGAILDKPVPTKAYTLRMKLILEKLDDILTQVSGMAVNVNQTTRHIHTTKQAAAIEDFNAVADKLMVVLEEMITDVQSQLNDEFPHAKNEVDTSRATKKKKEKQKKVAEREKAKLEKQKEQEAKEKGDADGNS